MGPHRVGGPLSLVTPPSVSEQLCSSLCYQLPKLTHGFYSPRFLVPNGVQDPSALPGPSSSARTHVSAMDEPSLGPLPTPGPVSYGRERGGIGSAVGSH